MGRYSTALSWSFPKHTATFFVRNTTLLCRTANTDHSNQVSKVTGIYIALYHDAPPQSNALGYTRATHTQTIPAFTPQPQGVIALWLVYSLRLPTKGWPG